MIRTAPRADVARPGAILALVLVGGMTAGFVAGQVAPDVVDTLFGASAASTTTPALTQNADFGIRHLGVTAPLSQVDDYGIRHITTAPLTPADDYGVRHISSAPLTPADDYGIRHQDQP